MQSRLRQGTDWRLWREVLLTAEWQYPAGAGILSAGLNQLPLEIEA